MNVRLLSDEALLAATARFLREERGILTSILHHLREIERRRLFAALKYSSLFDYAVRGLGYSEQQAYRRIAAMRMIKELPEIETKIESGALTLSHVGMAHAFFRREEQTKEKKLAIIKQLENTTTREAEKVFAKVSPIPLAPERIRSVSDELIELRFMAKRRLEGKIKFLKGALAHTNPRISTGDLFELLCDQMIMEKIPSAPKVKITRHIHLRDKSRCQNCGSTYALEVDHITPRAKGGSDDPQNLRLLCRSCNQRAAIEQFGLLKMEKHLEG